MQPDRNIEAEENIVKKFMVAKQNANFWKGVQRLWN